MFEIQFEKKKQDDRLCMGHFSICVENEDDFAGTGLEKFPLNCCEAEESGTIACICI